MRHIVGKILILLVSTLSQCYGEWEEYSIPCDFLIQGEYAWGDRPCEEGDLRRIGFMGFSKLTQSSQIYFMDMVYLGDKERKGFSLGAGFRKFFPCGDTAWGANVYLDSEKACSSFVHQLGVGLEYLSPFWEARVNAYLPIGKRSYIGESHFYDDYIGDYWVKCWKNCRTANRIDAELGRNYCMTPSIDSFVGIGAYGIEGRNGPSVWGLMGRLRLRYQDSIYLESNVYRDKEHGTQTDLRIGFTVSLCRLCGYLNFLQQPVIRRNSICSKGCCEYETNY